MEVPKLDGFQLELRAFVAACKAGRAPEECRPQDSAEAIRMTLAMRESRAQGGAAVQP